MKVYQVSRAFVWFMGLAKVVLTITAVVLYIVAVTNPTPQAQRLLLLAGLCVFGWLFYVRYPRMPREIALSSDGWVQFRGRKDSRRVHVTSIRSIGRSPGLRTVRLRYAGGRVRMPNRFRGFYDFLATVKGLNPAIEIRGF
jgi:hypothetical protein